MDNDYKPVEVKAAEDVVRALNARQFGDLMYFRHV